MTQPAGHTYVPAEQWVFGRTGMVERSHRCAPVLLVVAGGAFLVQRALVDVIVTVARDALGLGLPMQFFGSVAFVARHPRVRPSKWEVGDAVVEGVLIEPDDVGPPTQVIRVAGHAVGLDDI